MSHPKITRAAAINARIHTVWNVWTNPDHHWPLCTAAITGRQYSRKSPTPMNHVNE
ncbi:MAG: hypothetical protein MUC38_05260 [Cyclobacteriaceae bacterium]|jgi:hypothetical protein|nr:hypothetical protein [Cyclobacteriaceae bacterium]